MRSSLVSVAKTEDRETDPGIEVKPVYTADDAPNELEAPGEYPWFVLLNVVAIAGCGAL